MTIRRTRFALSAWTVAVMCAFAATAQAAKLTLVVYMGVSGAADMAQELQAGGLQLLARAS